jgi:hypothetical protein
MGRGAPLSFQVPECNEGLTELPSERRFMDLYIREMHLGQMDGHAHRLSYERSLSHEHYQQLEPAYMEYWAGVGNWGEAFPPLPDDSHLRCPWE